MTKITAGLMLMCALGLSACATAENDKAGASATAPAEHTTLMTDSNEDSRTGSRIPKKTTTYQ